MSAPCAHTNIMCFSPNCTSVACSHINKHLIFNRSARLTDQNIRSFIQSFSCCMPFCTCAMTSHLDLGHLWTFRTPPLKQRCLLLMPLRARRWCLLLEPLESRIYPRQQTNMEHFTSGCYALNKCATVCALSHFKGAAWTYEFDGRCGPRTSFTCLYCADHAIPKRTSTPPLRFIFFGTGWCIHNVP